MQCSAVGLGLRSAAAAPQPQCAAARDAAGGASHAGAGCAAGAAGAGAAGGDAAAERRIAARKCEVGRTLSKNLSKSSRFVSTCSFEKVGKE